MPSIPPSHIMILQPSSYLPLLPRQPLPMHKPPMAAQPNQSDDNDRNESLKQHQGHAQYVAIPPFLPLLLREPGFSATHSALRPKERLEQRSTYVWLSARDDAVFESVFVGVGAEASSSRCTATEKRRQKAGSRTVAILVVGMKV